jgi:hypothetical protein
MLPPDVVDAPERMMAPLFLPLSLLLAAPAQAQQVRDANPDRSYVAVVVGISAYDNMPEEVELDFARSDAATVASSLQDRGAFDAVFLLTDRNATKAALTETLRERVPQLVGPEDVLVVYFVGHGLGADLGVPTLLAYDSTVQNGNEDGFPVEQLAADVATWTRAGTTVLVTDAIHKNQLDGISFFGPAADQWPGIAPGVLVLSSSAANEPARDGAFGMVFADAVAGAADANRDQTLTAVEIKDYVTQRLAGSGQTPTFAGPWLDGVVLASGVQVEKPEEKVDAAILYGDHDIYKAKFVFRDGGSPTVQCRDKPVQPCDSSCYVHEFKAGPCQLSAFVDGQQVKGTTLAMVPGKYDCGVRRDKTLACIPPQVSERK